MNDMEQPQEAVEEGAPAWVMTFADLMSLLMCFFVLLLSFSEMDVQKYKQVAGSMKFAFGIQREVKVKDIPKGTSVVAREFSPGKPTPTALKVLQQQTTNDFKENMDFSDSDFKHAKDQADKLIERLKEEIEQGLVEVETRGDDVVIRIREKGSFPSGSAILQHSFHSVLDKIGSVLNQDEDHIFVSGHTDDVPIATAEYPSNWVLSAARASTVVHYFVEHATLVPDRLEIRAHADTRPVAPNDSHENRAKNRRVEIVIGRDKNGPTKLVLGQNVIDGVLDNTDLKLENADD